MLSKILLSGLVLGGSVLASDVAQAQYYYNAVPYAYRGVQLAYPYAQRFVQNGPRGTLGFAAQQGGRVLGYAAGGGPSYVTTPRYIAQPGQRYSAPAYGYSMPSYGIRPR